eukprot:CAMPEP_0113563788 /NCGR_PEP_ID=MMETSP0015_2-20120614/21258_1 /TAXON_ID=2838 /ORGANISM="Odontella" /LENGTH=112 /DNA_ID=CAMNT_0000465797 /DNA_START=1 /DNA_END=340 /DNA_ORIENTATION=+ /assembly_acc=CAM_ASM_000160
MIRRGTPEKKRRRDARLGPSLQQQPERASAPGVDAALTPNPRLICQAAAADKSVREVESAFAVAAAIAAEDDDDGHGREDTRDMRTAQLTVLRIFGHRSSIGFATYRSNVTV